MRPTYVSADDLATALGYAEAVDALDAAFREEDPSAGPVRSHLEIPAGELLLMPAHAARDAGVKLVTIAKGNPERGLPLIHGVYVLFAPETLVPVAIFDGAALTALRTAAVSALATRYLAAPAARRLVVFGAGAQARAHVHAMRAVRTIDHVTIVGGKSGRAADLVAELTSEGVAAQLGSAGAVADADIVCTCTTSSTPVFDAALVRPGTHVNAIGAYRPDARELEPALLSRARVVVETRSSALLEAGDVVLAIEDGALTDGALHELAPVVRGETTWSGTEITVFKSVGLALEDLAVAAAAAARLTAARPDDAGRP
ncbi:ornithine cyclodeaminase [Solirubrobacter pauli]|uniref:Ornithine cyclodeaminase n=1 Tax=Solirubrobacter pauli TaxID=166793 RepID=A0A660LIR6_9ACTN|nr:ornithine cyclodeaminase [Solirubrobacter pauli]